MRIGAVIVAAGMSTRMKQFKQLMPIGNLTFAERVVCNFSRVGVRDIVVVTGFRAEDVERVLRGRGVVFLRNERYAETEMFDSAKLGLSYLQDKVDRVFFCPVDVPFFLESTVARELACEGPLVIPVCEGRMGHPVLMDASLIPAVLTYDGEGGLGGALSALEVPRRYLEVDDRGAMMDADTREDYEKLLSLHNSDLARVDVRVTLAATGTFFGPGMVTLLRQIDETGSVMEACSVSRISYSKAWKMLRTAEETLGMCLVERQAGGKSGGSARLTERARALIAFYEELEQGISADAAARFARMAADSALFSEDKTMRTEEKS